MLRVLNAIYDFFLSVSEVAMVASTVALLFLFWRRARPFCRGLMGCTAWACIWTAYLGAVLLYSAWAGVFNIFAWAATAGLWPVLYAGVASFSHPGHEFLGAVVVPFAAGLFFGWLSQGPTAAAARNRGGTTRVLR